MSPSSTTAELEARNETIRLVLVGRKCRPAAHAAPDIGHSLLVLSLDGLGGLLLCRGWLHAQVMRDYVSDQIFADTIAEASPAAARANWIQSASRWLRKRGHDGGDADARPKKISRKKGWQWCLAVDNVLLTMTGHGFEAYQPQAGAVPSTWKHLTIAGDQGSDGFAAAWFLQRYLKLNVSFVWDISHGVWRDVEATGGSLGLKSFTRVLCIVFNLLHGPWENGQRFYELQESMSEYLRVCSPDTCPLFRTLYERIAADFGMDTVTQGGDLATAVWEEMRVHWSMQKKGEKVAMCRFGAWTKAAERFSSAWHFRLLQILYFGLQTGLFSEGTFHQAVSKSTSSSSAPASSSAESRVAVQRGNDEVNRLRAACKGNVHLAAIVLSDSTNLVRMRIMYKCTGPVSAWYSEQSKELRSCTEALEWTLRQVAGEIYTPLRDTWRLLGDQEVLEDCGIRSTGLATTPCSTNDPELIQQNSFAGLMGSWTQNLISFRVKRLLWLVDGFTGRQALLCSPQESERTSAAVAIRKLHEAYERAKNRQEPFWKKLVARCVLGDVPSSQLISVLQAEGWQATPAVQELVRKRCSVIAQSKISEDAFCIGRRKENGQSNRLMREKALWSALIDRDLGSGIHRFRQPPWRQEVVPLGEAGELAKSAFQPASARSWPKLKQIVGYNKKPAWYTANPDSCNLLYADLAVLRFADEKDQWGIIASKCAWASLFQGKNIAFRANGTDQWFLSLGDVSNIAVLGWPALQIKVGDKFLLRPDVEGKPTWTVVTCPEDWECVTLVWECPQSQALELPVFADAIAKEPTISAVVKGRPQPILVEAAQHAFWSMSLSFLNWVGREIGAECSKGASLLEVLLACVRKILPQLADAEVLDIVALRLSVPDYLEELIAVDDMGECMHEKDKQVVEEEAAQQERREHIVKTFAEEFRRERAKCSKVAAKQAHKSMKTHTGKKYASLYPKGDLTQDQAQELAPPGWRIYSDEVNLRWQCYCRPLAAKSRAWVLHGYNEACRRVLIAAWDDYLLRHGLTREACPIKDLWQPLGSSAGAAGSAKAAAARG